MNARQVILLLSIALLASMIGALAYRSVYFSTQGTQAYPDTTDGAQHVIGVRRPDYTLGSSTGAMVSASDFDGQVVLVNFWATWCKPCREEMPMLADLQHKYEGEDLQVVGIALDDVQQAREFAAEIGVNYPILVGSIDVMAVVRLYGNLSGVLPYSVLIDSEGIVRWAKLGVLDETELSRRIGELLK